mmetsp:Transcript_7359/g.18007  ORF Transcript_7359/g.18007 Transcript_7359/m.18007 type:complete len:111 (-) Transcript_7359:632-964(-)
MANDLVTENAQLSSTKDRYLRLGAIDSVSIGRTEDDENEISERRLCTWERFDSFVVDRERTVGEATDVVAGVFIPEEIDDEENEHVADCRPPILSSSSCSELITASRADR